MKPVIVLFVALTLAGCKPSEIYGPSSQEDELLGGEPAAIGAFPPGSWEDGLGSVWSASVNGDTVVSSGASDGLAGLSMTGTIDGDTLTYTIGIGDGAPLANGTARLIDGEHAYFKTLNADGSLNAHGLLHFNHSVHMPILQSGDLQAVSDCANPTLQGD